MICHNDDARFLTLVLHLLNSTTTTWLSDLLGHHAFEVLLALLVAAAVCQFLPSPFSPHPSPLLCCDSLDQHRNGRVDINPRRQVQVTRVIEAPRLDKAHARDGVRVREERRAAAAAEVAVDRLAAVGARVGVHRRRALGDLQGVDGGLEVERRAGVELLTRLAVAQDAVLGRVVEGVPDVTWGGWVSMGEAEPERTKPRTTEIGVGGRDFGVLYSPQ